MKTLDKDVSGMCLTTFVCTYIFIYVAIQLTDTKGS